jgi:quinolinate synthase
MKLNTMEKLYYCLRDEGPEIMMDHQLITQAALPIEKMLSMSATPVKL